MNKLLYNQSIIAVNRKTQNTYMIIIPRTVHPAFYHKNDEGVSKIKSN